MFSTLTTNLEAITLLERLTDRSDLTEAGRDLLNRIIRQLENGMLLRTRAVQ
jgi:ribosomal protein S19E (S16A)